MEQRPRDMRQQPNITEHGASRIRATIYATERGKTAQWLACFNFVKNETLPHSKKGRVNPINKLLACYRNSYVQPRALQHL